MTALTGGALHQRIWNRLVIAISGLACAASAAAFQIDGNLYPQVEAINRWLYGLEQPGVVTTSSLGYSVAGREILLVRVGNNEIDRPAILFLGGHHGDEPISTTVVLGLLHRVITHRTSPEIQAILRDYILCFQPLVNPDGYAAGRRSNAQGQDVNRGYALAPTPVPVPLETQRVVALMARHYFYGALSFHAGTKAVLWPLGFTHKPIPQKNEFARLGAVLAGHLEGASARASFEDYPTKGEFIDYAYLKFGTYAFTVEVSANKNPKRRREIQEIEDRATQSSLFWIAALKTKDARFASTDLIPVKPRTH